MASTVLCFAMAGNAAGSSARIEIDPPAVSGSASVINSSACSQRRHPRHGGRAGFPARTADHQDVPEAALMRASGSRREQMPELRALDEPKKNSRIVLVELRRAADGAHV